MRKRDKIELLSEGQNKAQILIAAGIFLVCYILLTRSNYAVLGNGTV